jgi:transcriptional regulator with XRE-family HTH domain
MPVSLRSRISLVRKLLSNKQYREAYVAELIKNGIPFQIRALRDQRAWTQAELGERAKKRPNAITRLEDPNYGKVTLRTLLEIASAFEVGLLVKFVPFSRLLKEYEDVSPAGLSVQSILDERAILEGWATSTENVAAAIATSLPHSAMRRGILPSLQQTPFLPGLREALASVAGEPWVALPSVSRSLLQSTAPIKIEPHGSLTRVTYENGQTVEVSESVSVKLNDTATQAQTDKVIDLKAFRESKSISSGHVVSSEATGTRG